MFCRPGHGTETPPSLYARRLHGRERVKMWRGVFEVWRALWSTPFHSLASNIGLRPLSNKPLWQSHAEPPTNTHTPCHLDMNGRLTFRAVSTLRSSFVQISLLPPPCLIRCQQFFTDIISGCKWIWTGWGCRSGGSGGVGVVMDKIPHWLQNAACGELGILNTTPPEPSSNWILNTHFYSRNIGCEIPPRKIAIQMRCVYFCMAFEERRGVVSLKRRKGPLR